MHKADSRQEASLAAPAGGPTRPRRASWFVAALAAVLLAAWPGTLPAAADGADADAEALMRRVDELWRGESSHALLTMRVQTERYARTMTMEAWSEGQEKSLVKILEPKKERGIATLRVEGNIWNYLPKINRVTKIPPSMMMGSWMGSHFTNDDLVKESSFEEDYDARITFRGERGGRAIYEVTALPRPEAAVVWGKVVMEIEQARLIPLRAEYYDEEGRLARVMAFEAPRRFGGRTLPARLRLTPADKAGEHTTVIYEDIRFAVKLPRGLFTLRGLRSR